MIPFQATIALNTLLPFSHGFFTQYTIVATEAILVVRVL